MPKHDPSNGALEWSCTESSSRRDLIEELSRLRHEAVRQRFVVEQMGNLIERLLATTGAPRGPTGKP
ncbi:MAG: hypothetical protein JNK15_10210 [Planctomycetes bacterium]|nr:hypothetical protein [Planctomycetota bacterium]